MYEASFECYGEIFMSRANKALSLGFFCERRVSAFRVGSANSKPQARLIVAILSRYPYITLRVQGPKSKGFRAQIPSRL